jgi:hypothetical protein
MVRRKVNPCEFGGAVEMRVPAIVATSGGSTTTS